MTWADETELNVPHLLGSVGPTKSPRWDLKCKCDQSNVFYLGDDHNRRSIVP